MYLLTGYVTVYMYRFMLQQWQHQPPPVVHQQQSTLHQPDTHCSYSMCYIYNIIYVKLLSTCKYGFFFVSVYKIVDQQPEQVIIGQVSG